MGLFKATGVVTLCGAMMLSGCSVATVRDKVPATPDECEANWLQETGAVTSDAIKEETEGETVVMSFLIAIARAFSDQKAADDRYAACLETVGVNDVAAFVAADSDLARELDAAPRPIAYVAPKRPSYCPAGASVLYGGSGYCVGR